MDRWFRISINGGTGYMKVVEGADAEYFDDSGTPIQAGEGTSVHVTENDVSPPNA